MIAGKNEAEDLLVERFDPTDGTVGASFVSTGTVEHVIEFLAVAEDGTAFVSTSPKVYELPPTLASAAVVPGMEANGSYPGELAGFGAQLAVTPDGSTLYETTGGNSFDEPGSYLVQARSITNQTWLAAYGNGTAECLITSPAAGLAIGDGGTVFALDHGTYNGAQTFGAKVLKLGPTGTGCGKLTSAPLTIESGGVSDPTTIAKGDTVSFKTSSTGDTLLEGFFQNEATWKIEGPEDVTLAEKPTGENIEASHRFLKGGQYTITFEAKTMPPRVTPHRSSNTSK